MRSLSRSGARRDLLVSGLLCACVLTQARSPCSRPRQIGSSRLPEVLCGRRPPERVREPEGGLLGVLASDEGGAFPVPARSEARKRDGADGSLSLYCPLSPACRLVPVHTPADDIIHCTALCRSMKSSTPCHPPTNASRLARTTIAHSTRPDSTRAALARDADPVRVPEQDGARAAGQAQGGRGAGRGGRNPRIGAAAERGGTGARGQGIVWRVGGTGCSVDGRCVRRRRGFPGYASRVESNESSAALLWRAPGFGGE